MRDAIQNPGVLAESNHETSFPILAVFRSGFVPYFWTVAVFNVSHHPLFTVSDEASAFNNFWKFYGFLMQTEARRRGRLQVSQKWEADAAPIEASAGIEIIFPFRACARLWRFPVCYTYTGFALNPTSISVFSFILSLCWILSTFLEFLLNEIYPCSVSSEIHHYYIAFEFKSSCVRVRTSAYWRQKENSMLFHLCSTSFRGSKQAFTCKHLLDGLSNILLCSGIKSCCKWLLARSSSDDCVFIDED